MTFIRFSLVLFLSAFPVLIEATPLIRSSAPVGGEYIVRLADDSPSLPTARLIAQEHSVQVIHVYHGVMRGFAFRGSELAANAIARRSHVRSVTEATRGRITGTQSPVPSVGLDRIDQRYADLDNNYTYDVTGAGTIIYIVDSGVNEVADLAGRIIRHRDFVDGNLPADDQALHGTSVASIAAGTVYGVAKEASVVNLRIVDRHGDFSTSTLLGALDDIWTHHPVGIAGVVNLSLRFPGKDATIDFAIHELTNRGIPVVGAGGDSYHSNSSDKACTDSTFDSPGYTPARLGVYTGVIVVSSVRNDSFVYEPTSGGYYYTAYGPCVDIFAPTGVAAVNDAGWPIVFSGTSASTPFVSGVAALVQHRSPSLIGNAAMIEDAIRTNATPNVVHSIPPDTVNLLLYSRP